MAGWVVQLLKESEVAFIMFQDVKSRCQIDNKSVVVQMSDLSESILAFFLNGSFLNFAKCVAPLVVNRGMPKRPMSREIIGRQWCLQCGTVQSCRMVEKHTESLVVSNIPTNMLLSPALEDRQAISAGRFKYVLYFSGTQEDAQLSVSRMVNWLMFPPRFPGFQQRMMIPSKMLHCRASVGWLSWWTELVD